MGRGSGRKPGQKIEKREDRHGKIASAIANMEIGEQISPTALARSCSIHPNSLRDLLDLNDLLKSIGFETLRDRDKKLKAIIRTNENFDTKKEIREMNKKVLDIYTSLDQIKLKLGIK